MRTMRTDIIPAVPSYYVTGGDRDWNLPAISIFACLGFFLDQDTYKNHTRAFRPATDYTVNHDEVVSEAVWFKWYHEPRAIDIKKAVTEFANIFHEVLGNAAAHKRIVLPLSGGLDSRTLAGGLRYLKHDQVFTYSYEFAGGVPENKYGEAIAKHCGFEFVPYIIPKGYLWQHIDHIANCNGCYADFITPRQAAVMHELETKGDLFLLGHWGDVLFDDMGVASDLSLEGQVDAVLKKITKRRGVELATALWQAWGKPGSFSDYLRSRIAALLSGIDIQDANARIRAFKSMYWAPRWTSTNLTIFQDALPISVPYYHEALCQFICSVPEPLLAGRQIQIEYLKQYHPALAAVPWQKYEPANLYSYKNYYKRTNIHKRAYYALMRRLRAMTEGERITSNWQIQLLGTDNERELAGRLQEYAKHSLPWLPPELLGKMYLKFKESPADYAHIMAIMLSFIQIPKLSALSPAN